MTKDPPSLVPTAVEPAEASPPRRPGSARRTASVDMVRPASSSPGTLVLAGRSRDLVTHADGTADVVAEAQLEAELDAGRRLAAVRSDPEVGASAMVGQSVGRGFRAAVERGLPGLRGHSLLSQLFEELPVASLVSGYADLYRRTPLEATGPRPDDAATVVASGTRIAPEHLPTDVCAGWRSDGSMMRAIDELGSVPIPLGPAAPELERTDRQGWHEMPLLPTGGMRRQRLLDVAVGEAVEVTAFFRDTHVEVEGTTTVLHEYELSLLAVPGTGEITACRAVPHVLPWAECPAAAASVERLVGRRLEEVPTVVRRELHGTSTCTHLNDLVRFVGAAPQLLPLVRS